MSDDWRTRVSAAQQRRYEAWKSPTKSQDAAGMNSSSDALAHTMGANTARSRGNLVPPPPLGINELNAPATPSPAVHRQRSNGAEVTDTGAPLPSSDLLHCPLCSNSYQVDSQPPQQSSRVPVLLVPCGHTTCRVCCSRHFQTLMQQHRSEEGEQSTKQPTLTCPQCSQTVVGTAINKAVTECISGKGAARLLSSSQALPTVPEEALDGPLPSRIRQDIFQSCRPEQAAEAEMFARRYFAAKRRSDMHALELREAQSEQADSITNVTNQRHISESLKTELSDIEAKLRSLELDKQLLTQQLQEVCEKQSECAIYEATCTNRVKQLEATIANHANEASRCESVVSKLVPTISLNLYAKDMGLK